MVYFVCVINHIPVYQIGVKDQQKTILDFLILIWYTLSFSPVSTSIEICRPRVSNRWNFNVLPPFCTRKEVTEIRRAPVPIGVLYNRKDVMLQKKFGVDMVRLGKVFSDSFYDSLRTVSTSFYDSPSRDTSTNMSTSSPLDSPEVSFIFSTGYPT